MSVHVSTKHKALIVPFREDVNNLFPNAKRILSEQNSYLVLPHGIIETITLKNLGVQTPSPLVHYDWAGGTPFDVQKKTCDLLIANPRAYVLNGMGTGKTRAALWSWDYLKSAGLVNKAIVFAPLSTLTFTWKREAFQTTPHRTTTVLHGDKKRRLERLNDREVEMFIINHDGLKVIYDDIAKRTDINTVIIDELAVYRNNNERTKLMRKFCALPHIKVVWGMSGAPIPHSPTDVWAQCKIITPNTVPRYFKQFRDDLMIKVDQFKYIPKDDAVDRAYKVMTPAVRFTLDDVIELPECISRTIDVELGTKQAQIYKQLVATARVAVANHEINAANAGAAMNKLLQISLGWVYTSDGKIVPLDNGKRIQTLLDCIEGTDRKVLVFVPFKHALNGIADALTNADIDHVVVSGDTPAGQRADIFNLFQNTDKYKVIAAHPQCLAHGITLTVADTIVWFGPIPNLEIYDQANHRIIRVGQKHKQQIIHLQSTAVERRIYSLLRNNQKIQNQFLELVENASKED